MILIGNCGLQFGSIIGAKNIILSGVGCPGFSSNQTTIIAYDNVNIKVDGTYSFLLVCNTGYDCNVDCVSDESCHNIFLDCNGTCRVTYKPGISIASLTAYQINLYIELQCALF